MKTNIKYRAYVDNKMVYWGSPYVDDRLLHFGILDPESINSDYINMSGREYELMSSTGLWDRNGKEIYENDIIKSKLGFVHKVVWSKDGYWGTKPLNYEKAQPLWIKLEDEIEVIGNIFENIELLK